MITPIDMSMPAGPWLELFGVLTVGLLAIIGDGITTMIGLGANKGFVEGNPIARWMFSKVGQSLTIWISAVAYLLVGAFIGGANWAAGMTYAGIVAAGEIYFAVKNYLLLKKLGIPIK